MRLLHLNIFLVFSLVWFGSTAEPLNGCLLTNCPRSTQLCVDDGRFGRCVERTILQQSASSPGGYIAVDRTKQRQKAPVVGGQYNKHNTYQQQQVQRSSISGATSDVTGQNQLLKQFVLFLIENGIDIRSLSDSKMHELVRSFIASKRASKKTVNKSEWPKRLLSTIQGARRLLNENGIQLADLDEDDLNLLSQIIAKTYLQQEGVRYRPSKPSAARVADGGLRKNVVDPPAKTYGDMNTDNNMANLYNPVASYPAASQQLSNFPNRQSQQAGDAMNLPSTSQQQRERKDQEQISNDPDILLQELIENQQKEDANKNYILNDEVPAPIEETTAGRSVVPTTIETTQEGIAKIDDNDSSTKMIIIPVIIIAILLVCAIFALVALYCFKAVKSVDDDEKSETLLRKQEGGNTGDKTDADYQELCRQHYAHEQSKSSTKQIKEPLLNKQHLSGAAVVANNNSSLKRSPMFSPTRNQTNRNSISSASSWSEEPVSHTLDISMAHAILSYMEDHLSKEDRLNEEWDALCDYKTDKVTFDIAQQNWEKNRTEKALPYDHNRVVINGSVSGGSGSSLDCSTNYINASYIIDNDPRSPLYIAAQGPLTSTVNEFWQMIWEQGCVAIVMLTPLVEETELQCARYWPDEGSCTYSIFEIHLVSEHIWCEDYLVRSLYVKNLVTGNTRTLTQFHFLSWPHDTVPPSAKHLLEMRRKVSKCYRSSNRPVMVHCSDGIGRTGTYILLDLVIARMLKGGSKEMDIAATLEHLRDQRRGLVCTKEQLQFALSSVADEVNAILKVLLQEETIRMPPPT